MRVVFWGTPNFALPSLKATLESDHEVAGVVTQPDRPAGRGRELRAPPVKRLAIEYGVPALQPEKPRGSEFMSALAELEPEVSIVVAYGEILRQEVLDLPRRGSFNVHASLLPKLRGAAPINWAIINGFGETGVTIMRMVAALDAGPVLHQVSCEIAPDETAGALADKLAHFGAGALLDVLARLEAGETVEREQDHGAATLAPKLDSEDTQLDWTRPAAEIDRWIRGSDPWPGAWSRLGGTRVKLFASRSEERRHDASPGIVLLADRREGLQVATGSGVIAVAEVQPEGRRRMKAVEWIRGRGIEEGARFV